MNIFDLIDALDVPEIITTPSRYKFDAVEAFCLTLARFRSAGDQSDLCRMYHHSQSAIRSKVINFIVLYIDEKWKHLLDFDSNHLLHPENLTRYAAAIYRTGAPIDSVWAFLDSYNGHKFQALMLPNGLVGHLHGPYEGRRNDNYLLRESGLLEKCAQYALRPGSCDETPLIDRYFQLYGDAVYPISPYLISPYYGDRSEEQQRCNNALGTVRVEVEHGFGLIAKMWPFLNAGWKMRLYYSLVGSYYRTGVLLTNALSCLHPNQTSLAFDCLPPTLQEYFHE
ncbi:hypothetical protein K435DRAFT_822876 [Dendrothele bispora CBS 962.96]|uniref:DDE Tnp4 domain-containing protein n=1 Tax=Dendrothele bispora (strain CBS 962.96) TaxID=1314807 RepID=A0A4S8L5K4_DENBC|nr:hypothetical protein K435DRAFT_822876 [Dendrothele bispora CBS 962.96]